MVFQRIVPPLLGLTGLPGIGDFQPLSPSAPPDLDIIDIALAALSFLGERGPAGEALKQVRSQFEQHLPQLAEYSLQPDGTLITPTVVPLRRENYRCYEECVEQWRELYSNVRKRKRVTEKDRITCISIYQQLLNSAEEVCYPAETHILCMLQQSQSYPDQPLQTTWQNYLCQQMNTGTYIDYQSCALLWAILFPEQQAQQELADILLGHLADTTKSQRYAQRFLISIINNLEDLRELIEVSGLFYLSESRMSLNNLSYLNYLIHLRYLSHLKALDYLKFLRALADLVNSKNSSYLTDLRALRTLGHFRNLRCLRYLILTEQVALGVEQRLHTSSETERVELLTILLGRVLQVQDANETGTGIEQEVQHIVQATLPFAQPDTTARDIVLNIVYHLPARTEQEVVYILDLAHNTQDSDVQNAYAEALKRSQPATDEAWATLEKAKTSNITVIREAVEKRLEWHQESGK